MSTTTHTIATPAAAARLADGSWRLDPARSSVAFHVRHFYGLMTVKGEFADYESTLDLGATPAVELAIQAATLETKLAKRRRAPALGRLLRRRSPPAGALRLRPRHPQ